MFKISEIKNIFTAHSSYMCYMIIMINTNMDPY
jgi:hypothetical protein